MKGITAAAIEPQTYTNIFEKRAEAIFRLVALLQPNDSQREKVAAEDTLSLRARLRQAHAAYVLATGGVERAACGAWYMRSR